VNDAVAYRRRVWFGVIVVTAFVLLGVAALMPNRTPPSLRVEQAGADETLPPAASTSSSTTPPTTVAPATTVPATTSTTAPATTTTTPAKPAAAPATTTVPVKAAPAPVVAPVVAAPPAPNPSPDAAAFLACVRQRESHNNYQAVSANGMYRGAYQFAQSAWDATARHAGRGDLVGVPPNVASPAAQDALALNLYQWQGAKPWGGYCT
jgi:cytoskeletal protein RodZ